MNQPSSKRPFKWWSQGKTPDYRFSLANERTFLAWIRTALAFMAGAVGINQFASEFGTPAIRQGLAIALTLAAMVLGLMAYRRWKANEKAMRHDGDMPYTRMLLLLTLFVVAIALMLTAVTLSFSGQ
ncbi:YidH family protein [Serratia entomophila]|uniref:YidH family protein n=1 Tax=Serratia entomophila TaxID=42906 RepID=UPI00217B6EFA|nr:DUF202 domain-containing protein [Serratia entomophila]CAI1040001.1 Inner membrane protein yidH [Serratia entomophila]CAI1719105.1 Inner membrane protein yidH [Serratia entomophila]CAI1783043.1 Inner membrane protein yidH [Serratia entomophila]CAI1837259.1 Inner membrane protein yidH [Serratia entomophila]CAI1848150.1 Inner membrane protein yidH [Serratia entomophila]